MESKQFYQIAILAAAFLFFAGCTGNSGKEGYSASDYLLPEGTSVTQVEGNSELLRYEAPQAGYYVVFRKGWALNASQNGYNVQFTPPEFEPGSKYAPSVQIYYSPPSGKKASLSSFTENYMELTARDSQITGEMEVLFGGNPGYGIVSIPNADRQITMMQAWTVYKGRVYVGVYSSSAENFEKYLPEAQRTLESVGLYVNLEGGADEGAGLAGGQGGNSLKTDVEAGAVVQGASGGASGTKAAAGGEVQAGARELTDFEKQLKAEEEAYGGVPSPVGGSADSSSGQAGSQEEQEASYTKPSSKVKPNPQGSWRLYDTTVDYLGRVSTPGSRTLDLSGSGTWQFGGSSGTWSVQEVSGKDWEEWFTEPYGPNYKIVLDNWGGARVSGPIETEEDGTVNFFWLIYLLEDGRQAQVKFGR